jgi:hypothetical protein
MIDIDPLPMIKGARERVGGGGRLETQPRPIAEAVRFARTTPAVRDGES